MTEELPPSLFKILREDNRDFRTEISGRLDGLARDMVTAAVFAAYQVGQKATDDRQDARLKALEQAEDERTRELREVVEDQKKARAQLLTSIGLAVFATVLTIIGGVTIWSIQNALTALGGG